jgi:sugar/nucleoside kinase (ribokinase family)
VLAGQNMSLLVVGSVAFDTVETPFGKRERALGGSATYFSISASFFTKPEIVAVIGEDFSEEHLALLRSRGIGLSGLTRAPGKTFHWAGHYGFDLNTANTLATELNVFQTFSPDLPAELRRSELVFLGNIDPDLQWRVLQQVERPRLVAADTMNFWITSKPTELRRVLSKVDLLLVNDAEARMLAGEHNVVKAARAIIAMGAKRVAIKRGEYGALLFDGDHVFAAPAFPLPSLFDPTGAGDSFAGGLMGALDRSKEIDGAALRRAIIVGTVMASFVVEQFSVDRFRTLTSAEIHGRYREIKQLVAFEDIPADLLG